MSEHATELSDVKNSIAQLYHALHVEEHQLQREKQILEQLDDLRVRIEPYEAVSTVNTRKLTSTC